MKSFSCMDVELAKYVAGELGLEDPVLQSIRDHCVEKQLPEIQVSPFDGRHLEVLAACSQARRGVEIGTLGGYSGVSLLKGMGRSGHLHTFELDAHHAEVARENFERAGLMDQVYIHVGPALENLEKIEAEGPFDLVFIDADKRNYPNYLKWATNRLKVGGVLIADNTFGFGHIHKTHGFIDGSLKTQVAALRQFNRELASSSRFHTTILPTGEGLTLGVKKA